MEAEAKISESEVMKVMDKETSTHLEKYVDTIKHEARLYRSRSLTSIATFSEPVLEKAKSLLCINCNRNFKYKTRSDNAANIVSSFLQNELTRNNSLRNLSDQKYTTSNPSFSNNSRNSSVSDINENRRRKFRYSLHSSSSSIAEETPGPSRQNSRDDNELEEIEQLLANASENLQENEQNNLVELLQRELESYAAGSRHRHCSSASLASSRDELESSRSVADDQRSLSDFDENGQEDSGDETETEDTTERIVRNPPVGNISRHQREFADAIVRMSPVGELHVSIGQKPSLGSYFCFFI